MFYENYDQNLKKLNPISKTLYEIVTNRNYGDISSEFRTSIIEIFYNYEGISEENIKVAFTKAFRSIYPTFYFENPICFGQKLEKAPIAIERLFSKNLELLKKEIPNINCKFLVNIFEEAAFNIKYETSSFDNCYFFNEDYEPDFNTD